ncbi:MAG TPA: hypothetical protein VF720_13750, partial [Candidatus Eisenbacteria bacterium]
YDVQGRRIWDTTMRPETAGLHCLQWSGCGLTGAPVPAGTYFVRLDSPSGTANTRVTVVR